MTTQVRKGGAWRTITAAKVFKGGAWRTLVAIKVYAGGSWRTVGNFTAPPSAPSGGGGSGGGSGGGTGGGGTITVSISPSSFAAATSNQTTVTQSLTATPSGGLAPYTYAWTVVSSGASVSFSTASAATTNASMHVPLDDGYDATLRCTVTDSLGTVGHADVAGSFTNNS